MDEPYHRRYGVIRRAGVLGGRPGNALTGSPDVINGGQDAPLRSRDRRLFYWIIAGTVFVGLVLLLLTVVSR